MEPLKVWIVSLLEKKSRALLFEGWGGGGVGGGSWTSRPWDKGEPGLKQTYFSTSLVFNNKGRAWICHFLYYGLVHVHVFTMIACLMGKVWVGVHHLWEVFDRCWRKEQTMLNTSFWQQPIRVYSNNAHHEVANCCLLPRSWKMEHDYWLHLACERQTFLLAHRRWETFHEEERLRLSDRNSILMTQNLSGIQSEALIGRRRSFIVLAIVYEWKTKGKRPQKSNVNAMNL